MNDQMYYDAASIVVAAGQIPIPVNDTLIQLLKVVMTDEQAKFIKLLNKPLTRDEIREISGLDDAGLDKMLNGLMDNGVITGMPGRSSETVIYRVLPPIPGLFEFTMMRGEKGEKQKKLAHLFEKIFNELADLVQQNYDVIVPVFKSIPPLTRVIPVETQVDRKFDMIMPHDDVQKIIDRFDTIAVAHCYCRHQKDLLGKPCLVTEERKNCLVFGRSARFIIDHKFGEEITKDKARKIVEDAEKSGLVHKAFHEKSDIAKEEMAICNCCKCCCETFQIFYRGASPEMTYASYIAKLDSEACSGCEVCVDKCPMEAIKMVDDIAHLDEARCIGCGVCSYHCPTEAFKLERTGQREIYVPPPRLKANAS
jgi:ferredoxin/predicted transcriptional regulator